MEKSKQNIKNFIDEKAEDIANELISSHKRGNKINIDNVYWESLYAVDEIKTTIADKIIEKISKNNIIIE